MGRKMPAQNSQGTSVVIENEGGLDIVQADNGKEIRYTRDYGVGLDVHSKFIEVNVLVKNNLSVFEYHKSFKTDWASVNKANQWVVDTIVKYSDPAVDMSNGLHYTLESTSSYHQLVITAWKGIPCIVNPNLARAGRKKSDILDSKTLSISDLTGVWPSSYIPSIDAVELRMLVDERRLPVMRFVSTTERNYTPAKSRCVVPFVMWLFFTFLIWQPALSKNVSFKKYSL